MYSSEWKQTYKATGTRTDLCEDYYFRKQRLQSTPLVLMDLFSQKLRLAYRLYN